MATGFLAVFDNFQKEATGNRTDPETKQPQPLVRSLSVGFGPVLRFFSVLATEPSNTMSDPESYFCLGSDQKLIKLYRNA